MKLVYLCCCLWKAAIEDCFQKIIVLRSSHKDVFFNITILNVWLNSWKNACDEVQFLVNLHVKLSCFCLLVQKSYISSHHFVKQLLLWNTQKQPSRGVLKKRCSENRCFATLFEIALRHGCSPVNLLHIFKTSFFKNVHNSTFMLF